MHEASFFAEPRNWVAISFIIFFVLFGGKLWKALAGILDKRTQSVQAELNEAQRLRREAEVMLADAAKRRESAMADAKALLDGARREATRLADLAAKDAEASAHRREKMAMDRIAAAEKAAVDQVRHAAAEIASIAAERVIREELTAEADGHLVDNAIGSLASALAPRRAA